MTGDASGDGPSGAPRPSDHDVGRPVALSAVTLHVADMARAAAFYDALGFTRLYGGPEEDFTSYALGGAYLNLMRDPRAADSTGPRPWGRVIVHVDDVDAMHRRVLEIGAAPHDEPRDAPWGERFFHVNDPDGHELSFARPLAG